MIGDIPTVIACVLVAFMACAMGVISVAGLSSKEYKAASLALGMFVLCIAFLVAVAHLTPAT